mmetsp:Transcript_31325/g.64097  ORF Transcript_31325/g.64097 Transcript_31325/m.64097 type:complete len:215 (+) Transcript_31325:1376-2020(+)
MRRSRTTRASAPRSLSPMRISSNTVLRLELRKAESISSSSITPLPSWSTTMHWTLRASAISSNDTSPSPSVSNASSDISLNFLIRYSTADTVTPQTRKKPMPTSKNAVCKNSNVSRSMSSSPRNRSDRSPTTPPSAPPVTKVERNRPMKPKPPISPSMESTTDINAEGNVSRTVLTDSSHATRSETMDSMTPTDQRVEEWVRTSRGFDSSYTTS